MENPPTGPRGSTFSLLTQLAGDPVQLDIFSEQSSVEGWLAAERALALAQAEHGVLTDAEAESIAGAARYSNVDMDRLWEVARAVGYPVHGLVQEIGRSLDPHVAGRVHFGATTQDIMDTGLVLQLVRSAEALEVDLGALGDALAHQVTRHAHTLMPARTHAQQAVPTTFGATLATLLGQLIRHRLRLSEARPRLGVVSLFGAGGTAAALGPRSREVRKSFARILDLRDPEISWHAERDRLAEFGWLCASLIATCARLGRNVVDLSRTEIAEAFEPYATHRGASSTMPQKVNPISSEILIGLSGASGALTSALLRIQEAGHERAAGEWQTEWQVIPQLAVLAGSALKEATALVIGLRVDAARMRENLNAEGGLVMSEAQMMHLAASIGHNLAHELVYEAATRARSTSTNLTEALRQVAGERGQLGLLPEPLITPEQYLGEAVAVTRVATDHWRNPAQWRNAAAPHPAHEPIAHLAVRSAAREHQTQTNTPEKDD